MVIRHSWQNGPRTLRYLQREKHTYAAGVLLASLLASLLPDAAANVPVELVAQWGGPCSAVAVSDGRGYLGAGQRLVVLDVSNPASLVLLGRPF